jgi:hypothetical protein
MTTGFSLANGPRLARTCVTTIVVHVRSGHFRSSGGVQSADAGDARLESCRNDTRASPVVIANPATSTTTGWLPGFWWIELSHSYFLLTQRGYEIEVFTPDGGPNARTGAW